MKRRCILYSFIGLFLFFCACGNSENIPDTDSEDAIDFETIYREEKTNNVIEEAWKKGTEQTDNTTMLMVDYISNVFTEYTEGQSYNVGYFSDYKYIYALNECFPKNENKWFYSLDIFDVDTMKASGNIIKDVEGILINPYAIAGRVFASNIKSDSDGILTNYSVIELQPDGTVNEFTDTFDILMENEWIPEPHVVPMTELKYEPASGYTYILSEKRDQLIVIDQDGTRIEEFTGFIDWKTRMSFYSYSQDGYLIFLAVEKGEEKFLIYKNKRFETVYAGEMGNEADESYQVIDGHGRILFLQNNSEIVSWDTKSGQQDIIYKSGTSNSYYSGIYAFARNEKGELLIFSKNNIKVLSYAGTGKSVEITVKPLLYTSNYLKQCINRYMETHPGVIINLLPDTEWDARDIELNKVYSEITNEEGPDLLLVWDDQLVNLEKSNCLYDLSEVLKPEVEASLVPAVRDAGKIDNKKYEMVTQPEINTFFINRKYCDGDTWTITDILDVIEKREKEGNPFEQIIASSYGYYENPFFVLLTRFVCESEFVDADEYKCYFDSAEFVRLLEICKRYNDDTKTQYYDEEESLGLFKSDKALLYVDYNMSIGAYSQIMAALGDDYRTIGYPTGAGKNKDIMIYGPGIAVNSIAMQDPDKKLIIEDFLNCIYTPEYLQETIGTSVPVRMDVYEGRIIDKSELFYDPGADWAIRIDEKSIYPLTGKRDGSNCVDEYLELLKGCDNVLLGDVMDGSVRSTTIMDIITEETSYFFEGDKSAEEVAKTIQSRVKLYLMELQ